jgi:hypothetical protein
MTEWADRVERHLHDLGSFLRSTDWFGRENELVNLFAHSFLTRSIPISQIGIEVAVRQLARSTGKVLVRKDLVVWSEPNQTVWNRGVPTNSPVAILEFKTNHSHKCKTDVEWLTQYTDSFPSVLGYSICGFIGKRRGVMFRRIRRGVAENEVFSPSPIGSDS